MTTRTDVSTDYINSPRIIEVDAPSTEMTMQDLVDTGRKLEDSFQGMSYKKLLNASGKEDLGGGTKVGITVALQDTKLAFEARTTPAEVGTITSVPTSPVPTKQIFQDSTATFITNEVQRGSLVINFTDHSIADVITVDSETQLTTKVLVNGTTNTYQVNDDYQVFNVEQVQATGGNLTAVDSNGDSFSPILPTAFTQVILTSSSSATLQDSEALQASSYNKNLTVTWDPINGITGTVFPAGTKEAPSKYLSDVLSICETRGIEDISIIGNITLDTGDDITAYQITGEGANRSSLIINPGAVCTDAEFEEMALSGTLDGNAIARSCSIDTLNYVSGFIHQCAFNGTLTLEPGVTCHILSCYSGIPGDNTPVFDCGGSGKLAIRDYNGGVEIRNVTGGQDLSIDMNSGQVKIDLTTCTNGNIVVRGVAKVKDTSGNHLDSGTYNTNLVITNECVSGDHIHEMWTDMGLNPDISSSEVHAQQITDKILDEPIASHTTAGSVAHFIQTKLLTVAKFLGLK